MLIKEFEINTKEGTIDLENFANGTYFISIKQQNLTQHLKVLKQ